MSVKTNYIGRFGNNVFQYVCARLFAEDNGLKLLTAFNHPKILSPAPHKSGISLNSPVVNIDDNTKDIFSRKWGPACYDISGYFHHWEWYQNRRDEIKAFMRTSVINKNTEDIVMHVRLGDYMFHIHPQWYLDILKNENFKKLYIVMESKTGALEEKYISYFKQYDPVVVSTDYGSDWHFIRQFDKILCSNSTFGWWAAYLSEASKMYIFKRWCDRPQQYDLGNIPNGIVVDGPMIQSYLCPNDPPLSI